LQRQSFDKLKQGFMANNGKSEGDRAVGIDVEHELSEGRKDEAGAPESQSADGAQTTKLAQEIERLRGERDSLFDRLARQQAEFENARRRAARDQAEYKDYATADFAKSLLPIMDSFERALKTNASSGDFRAGVELIYRQLQDALTRLGVQPIAAAGEPFDPRFHEAVEMVPTNDAEDDHVLEELQRGYKLKDRLLRPAMVRVARKG
jgi:molecular chaperone GrpE